MKKVILSIAVLAALSTTSCKKAYECTCETTYSTSYEAVLNDTDYEEYADDANDAEAETEYNDHDVNKTVVTVDKTSKAAANASCVDSENTETETEQSDYNDADSDDNTSEAGVIETTVTKTDCSLEKKK